MSRPLTSRQARVYEAIRHTHAALGEGVREAYLVRATGMTRGAVRRHLEALAKKGRVEPGRPVLPRPRDGTYRKSVPSPP